MIDVVDHKQFPASAGQGSLRGGDRFRALDQEVVFHGIHCGGGHVDLAALAVFRASLHGELHRLAGLATPDPEFGQKHRRPLFRAHTGRQRQIGGSTITNWRSTSELVAGLRVR